jgi:hypothetical protein
VVRRRAARKAIAAALPRFCWSGGDNSSAATGSRLETALAVFLTRQGCPATVVGSETVRVELPHTLHGEQARMEVDLYVRLWQALHGVRVEVVAD